MDLLTEMTKTHNAERWYEHELAAFEDEEPAETTHIDMSTSEVDVISVRGRQIRLGKVRSRKV